MKVLLNDAVIKCFNFCDLKAGDVFGTNHGVICIKTSANTCFNVCTGVVENYNGEPITPYIDAVLDLEPTVSKIIAE